MLGCCREMKAMQPPSPWTQLYGAQNHIHAMVVQDVTANLVARAPGPRALVPDDAVFAPLATASAIAIARQDYQFAIRLFHETFPLAVAYEQAHNCEIHKGAMTFNVALAYLRANDFPAAMHYFELAQRETQLTTNNPGWGIYQMGLFQQNYWAIIDLYHQQQPLAFYQDFWATPFNAAAAQSDWAALLDDTKLLYIVLNAERISYRRLTAQPGWPISQSFGLSNWNLIADLSRLLETELSNKGMNQQGLRAKVLHGVNHSPVADFHAEVTALHAAHSVNTTADFIHHFPAYWARITNVALTREQRIAAAAVFAGVIRNQVQHSVDTSLPLFNDRAASTFTSDVLLTLCRHNAWAV
jgi:hypothetical protein